MFNKDVSKGNRTCYECMTSIPKGTKCISFETHSSYIPGKRQKRSICGTCVKRMKQKFVGLANYVND